MFCTLGFLLGEDFYLSEHKRSLIILDHFLEEIYICLEFQWVGQKYLLAQFKILGAEELF